MSFVSLIGKLALPVSLLASASFTSTIGQVPTAKAKSFSPDSTLTVPIEVINKDRQPTVVLEKEVVIPQGYVYLNHELSLVSAFPIEGTEQTGTWIAGPNNSWSVYATLEMGRKQAGRIVIRASAAPGRKNEEVGAQAILLVGLQKLSGTN